MNYLTKFIQADSHGPVLLFNRENLLFEKYPTRVLLVTQLDSWTKENLNSSKKLWNLEKFKKRKFLSFEKAQIMIASLENWEK